MDDFQRQVIMLYRIKEEDGGEVFYPQYRNRLGMWMYFRGMEGQREMFRNLEEAKSFIERHINKYKGVRYHFYKPMSTK